MNGGEWREGKKEVVHRKAYNAAQKRMINFSMDASEEKFVAYVTGTQRYNNKRVGIYPLNYRVTILSEGKYTEGRKQNEQRVEKRAGNLCDVSPFALRTCVIAR